MNSNFITITEHQKKLSFLRYFICIVIILSIGSASYAQDETKIDPIDPYALHIMKQMGKFLGNVSAYSFRSEVAEDDVLPSGVKLRLHSEVEVALNRPNKLWVDIRDDHSHRTFTYDGSNVNLYFVDRHLYAHAESPATIDETINLLIDKYGYALPLADLMFSNPNEVLMAQVKSGFYAGLHTLKGIRCHHLVFQQENIDWQIWIEQGKLTVPRQIVITYKNEEGSPQFGAEFHDWELTKTIEGVIFQFDPPPGASEIEFFEITETMSEE